VVGTVEWAPGSYELRRPLKRSDGGMMKEEGVQGLSLLENGFDHQ
jgi:hypothetical protein